MSVLRKIDDIVYEFKTYEYSKENLDIKKDILNLSLLEHKLDASEFYNEHVELFNESVDDSFYMERFEKTEEVGKKIAEKANNIFGIIVKGLKSTLHHMSTFISAKAKILTDLVKPTENIKKYLANHAYDETAADRIKSAIESVKKSYPGIVPTKKQPQELALGNFNKALSSVKNELAVALNTSVRVYNKKPNSDGEQEYPALNIKTLFNYYNQITTGSDAVFKGIATSLKAEAKSVSKSGVVLEFDKVFTNSSAKLEKLETKFNNMAERKSGDKKQSNSLDKIQGLLVQLKGITGSTIALYNSVINYRKAFVNKIAKSILKDTATNVKDAATNTAKKVEKAVKDKTDKLAKTVTPKKETKKEEDKDIKESIEAEIADLETDIDIILESFNDDSETVDYIDTGNIMNKESEV